MSSVQGADLISLSWSGNLSHYTRIAMTGDRCSLRPPPSFEWLAPSTEDAEDPARSPTLFTS